MGKRAASLFVIAGGVAILGACADKEDLRATGPGAGAWKDNGTVACTADTDCAPGEICGAGVCQMKRCGEPDYRSVPPLGSSGYFKRDREIVVAESVAGLRGFEPENGSFRSVEAPWAEQGAVPPFDVAGGNFDGKRPEGVASIEQSSSVVTVRTARATVAIPLGFVPVAITSGDVDGDGIDEVIALGDTGTVAACAVATKKCTTTAAPVPVRPTDIAAGDLDGDGYAEVVVLAGTSLAIVNFDSELTGDKRSALATTSVTLTRISMGDLDGDGKDDIVGIEDGWLGDSVHVLDVQEDKAVVRTSAPVTGGVRDVVVGPTGTESTTITVLGDGNHVSTLAMTEGKLSLQYSTVLANATNAERIALADLDGDSPVRVLRAAPKLVPGRVVPLAVLTLPPYSRTHSDGVSRAYVGGVDKNEKAEDTTVILRAAAGLRFGGEVGPIVTASVGATLSRAVAKRDARWKQIAIGGAFNVDARPEEDGYSSGAVMIGCACYHQYQYVIEDPRGVLGPSANGETMDVFVPVGGQTSVWSTRRYNALAESLGTLPKITVPYKMGRIDSYPDSPRTLDGKPIQADDLVFTKPPSFRTSDVASVSFDLTVRESATRDVHVTDGVSVTVEVGAFGVTASGEVGVQVSKGYTITIGKDASFGGAVPAVRNDASTPEDEHELYGYSFTPIVYRHRYVDEKRQPSAFYVLTYAVGK